jgi:acyl carrier protein
MEPFELLKSQIIELTDTDPTRITPDTQLVDLNLVSLDYVSIQVAVKKEYGIQLDLNRLSEQGMSTVGDFARYVKSLH